jgi:hypothetical protein
MAIRTLGIIDSLESAGIDSLSESLGYVPKTVVNIVTDLLNLILIIRNDMGDYSVREELSGIDLNGIASFIRRQLEDHVVIQTIGRSVDPGDSISQTDFLNIIQSAYSSATRNQRTLSIYADRLLPWFRFAGLLELSENRIVSPADKGSEFGHIDLLGRRVRASRSEFMCESSPDRVYELAIRLAQNRSLSKSELLSTKNRNSANDLISLGLASRAGDLIVPTEELEDAQNRGPDAILETIRQSALSSTFLKKLAAIFASQPDISIAEAGASLAKDLGRVWADSSAIRYSSAGHRWLSWSESDKRKF